METKTTPDEGTAKSKKGTVPVTDIDFGSVAANVAAKWNETPSISLGWTTASEFTAQATAYNAELAMRLQYGGGRSQLTQALKEMENTMDDAIGYVKGYILEKYKKESASSYYPAFGIEHKKHKHVFPIDRNKRLASVELMITAMADNGFNDKEFGKVFWENIKTEYQALIHQASSTDGNISGKVSAKNMLRASLTKALNSLIAVIKGRYPDTYKAELRIWGFQKEKY